MHSFKWGCVPKEIGKGKHQSADPQGTRFIQGKGPEVVTRDDCLMLISGELSEGREGPVAGRDQKQRSHPEPRVAPSLGPGPRAGDPAQVQGG